MLPYCCIFRIILLLPIYNSQALDFDCGNNVMSLLTKFELDSKFSNLERETMYSGDGGTSSLEPQRQAIMVDLINFKRETKVL